MIRRPVRTRLYPRLGLQTWAGLAAAAAALLIPLPALAAPVISEFSAANVSGLEDEDGSVVDWLEIHNPDAAAVDLSGYYLTDKADRLDKWMIPAGVTLAGGEFLVVFASEKNRTDPASALHTNFKLSRSGEYFALVAPDGATVVHAFSPSFPEQVDDVSYGLANSNEVGNPGFFDPPTPGAPNSAAFATFVSDVEFSHQSGVFFEPVQLVLSGAGAGETIRYVLRTGRSATPPPDETADEYTGPITITETTQVRARVFAADGTPGRTASHTFLAGDTSDDDRFTGSTFREFTSHLPIVVLTSFGSRKPTNDADMHWLIFEPKAETGGRASVLNEPDLSTRGRMKVRGSSTAGDPKYSLSVEAWDEDDADVDVQVLDLPAESDWVLHAPYHWDHSLIHNPFMYRLSNQIGRYAVRDRFVEVFMDVDGSGLGNADYFGLYSLMEKIKRGNDRVDIAGLGPDQVSEEEVTGGYIFKEDRLDPGDRGFSIPGLNTMAYIDPKEREIAPEQATYLRTELTDLARTLKTEDGISTTTGRHFTEMIDMPAWFDHHWLNTLAMNVDGFRLSAYYHKDRGGRVVAGPIWDFDRTLASEDGRDDRPDRWDGTGDSSKTWWDTRYQWWGDLLGFNSRSSLGPPRFTSTRPDVFQQHADRWFELRQGAFSIENMNALIDTLVAEIGDAADRNAVKWRAERPRRGYEWEIDNMKGWIERRVNWIDAQYPAVPAFGTPADEVAPGVQLAVSSSASEVYITTDGSDPRADGGEPAAGAVTVTGGSETRVVVQEDAACRYYIPTNASVDGAWKEVDFNAAGWASGANGLGYETTPKADGGGLWPEVSTDLTDVLLGAGTGFYARFTFQFDGDPADVIGGLFRAKFDDGFIAYLNGVEIGSANAANRAGEEFATTASAGHSDSLALQWDDAVVTLAGEAQVELVRGALRQGENVLAIHALNTSTTGDILFRGELSIDTAIPAPPVPIEDSGLITARSKEGEMWSAPQQVYYFVGESRATAENLVVSEVMYNPAPPTPAEALAGFLDSDDFEFIELLNTGATTVSLAGVVFSNGLDFDAGTEDPPRIAPGGRALLVRNTAAFEARYGAGLPVIGTYEGTGLNNGGERIEIDGIGGGNLHSFRFDDEAPWPTAPDGTGVSLVLKSPFASPDHDVAANWAAGSTPGGTPGTGEGSYAAWKAANGVADDLADDDGDGRPAVLEFVHGSDPAVDDSASPEPITARSMVIGGAEVPVIAMVVDPAALDSELALVGEASSDLTNWSDAGGRIRPVAQEPAGDGLVAVLYEILRQPGDSAEQPVFVRFRAETR